MIPDSPVYLQANFVGAGVQTTVSAGVTSDMLLMAIAHFTAHLAVSTNRNCGGVVPMGHIIDGIAQRMKEIAPSIISAVQPQPPQEKK